MYLSQSFFAIKQYHYSFGLLRIPIIKKGHNVRLVLTKSELNTVTAYY